MLTVLQFIYKTSYIYSFLVNGVAVINPSDVLSFDFSINNQNLYAFTHFKVFRLRRKTLFLLLLIFSPFFVRAISQR